ncbi:endonuclease/exonuclease/phosphatase family protein [Halomonas halocynthiae]|uniref:endonuclease/exonuclease/phosphatase family protein n=1 Tax=Halomonas halocynthiae TaxID=176290 RepID=UPI0004028364|nr:endonuclease/exonuclease/phosphatase family protein [Halomonas halocynthiae]
MMTPPADSMPTLLNDGRLRLLTFNLQVGIQTSAYYHYLTRSWQHVLPHPKRQRRLELISNILRRYDIVGLQEADGGSFRSGSINQVDYLAQQAGFPHHYQQLNRNLGRLAQHSNGLLSRLTPAVVEEHRLPGTLPGRGAMHARYGSGPDALHIFVAHLALSQRGRDRQLDYLSEIIEPLNHIVVMGDLNCSFEQIENNRRFCEAMALRPIRLPPSYPSWQPSKALDHILLSDSLQEERVKVLNRLFSDHLPVSIDVRLPDVCLQQLAEHFRLLSAATSTPSD